MKPIRVRKLQVFVGDQLVLEEENTTVWQGDFREGTKDMAELKAMAQAEMDAKLGRGRKA